MQFHKYKIKAPFSTVKSSTQLNTSLKQKLLVPKNTLLSSTSVAINTI